MEQVVYLYHKYYSKMPQLQAVKYYSIEGLQYFSQILQGVPTGTLHPK